MANFIKATALYHDGKSNYQANYSGEPSKVFLNFKSDMDNRNVVWAHLFAEDNGQLLLSYGESDIAKHFPVNRLKPVSEK